MHNKPRTVGKSTSAGNNGKGNNNGEDNNEDAGSKTFGKIPSGRNSKPSSVRAFVQANRNQNRMINSTSVFQNDGKSTEISPALIKNARKSGVLNISGRNLNNGNLPELAEQFHLKIEN